LIGLFIFENSESGAEDIRIYGKDRPGYKNHVTSPREDHESPDPDRLQFALGRFKSLKAQIWVRLSDDNGPRGGIDKCCRFEVRIPGMRPLLIDERDKDLYVAIGRGTHRIERRIARMLSRRQPVYGSGLPAP
jgi:ribosome-associated translation inhibitor RaiA